MSTGTRNNVFGFVRKEDIKTHELTCSHLSHNATLFFAQQLSQWFRHRIVQISVAGGSHQCTYISQFSQETANGVLQNPGVKCVALPVMYKYLCFNTKVCNKNDEF